MNGLVNCAFAQSNQILRQKIKSERTFLTLRFICVFAIPLIRTCSISYVPYAQLSVTFSYMSEKIRLGVLDIS